MPTIASIRAQYPQYKDLSDQQLADSLHAKFYPDMPQGEFYGKIGYGPAPDSLEDQARSVLGGLVSGAAGMADQLNPAAIVGGTAATVARMMKNPKAAAFLQSVLPPSTAQQGAAQVGGGYEPRGTAARYEHSVAAMAPNMAMGGEGIVPRVAAAVLPGLGGQGASDAAASLGAGPKTQAVARFVGGVAGGFGAGMVNAGARGADLAPQLITKQEQPVAASVRAALALDGTTPAQAQAAVAGGKLPVTASPGLSQLGETVAQQPGVGAVHLQDAVGARMAGARDRALQAVQTHLGVDPAAAQGDVQSIVQQGRQAVGPAYDALRADPSPVWNADLANLAQRPAIKKAVGVAANEMLNEGQSPTAAGFQLDPDTGWGLPKTLDNVEQQPTAATWIKVHQALGKTVERSPLTNRPLPDSLSSGNYGIRTSGNDLGSALTDAIPGYGDVLSQSGDYLSVNGAFERAGKRLFNGPVSQFSDMWDSLQNPSEQNAARASVANDILTRSEGGSFLPGQFRSPGVQQKLAIAFGPDAAANFTDQMESDLAERGTYNRILQGSPTARRTNLEAAYQAQQAPVGIGGKIVNALQNSTGMADTIASFTHPVTAITRTMNLASKALGGSGDKAAPPWADPSANAQLGQVLSDPAAFTGLLGRMGAQDAADAQAQAAGQQGLLTGFAGAAPGLLSAVLAPQAALAVQGQQPQ
jgi:hypothetical protein